jgi:hypothetical protein
MKAARLTARSLIFPHATSLASCLAATAVIGIPLRLTSARFGSIFATDEQFFVVPGSLLNPATAVGGRGYSRSFASADGEP